MLIRYVLRQIPSSVAYCCSNQPRLIISLRNEFRLINRCLSTQIKKETDFRVESVKRSDILKDVIVKKKEQLKEKRATIIQDLREKKEKVKEKVEEVKEKVEGVKEKVEEVIERENIMTIPNFLTVGRSIISPYIGYVIIQGDYNLAMGLLVVAGLSDLADGYIARHWPNQASRLGSFLDPMADKLLMGSLVISLTYCNLLPLWLTGMIVFRDVFLIGAGFVIRYQSLPPPRTLSRYFDVTHATAELAPTFVSKVNTAVQLVTVAATLGAPIWDYIDHPFLYGLWYLTGVTTALAALSYIVNKDTYRFLNKKPKK